MTGIYQEGSISVQFIQGSVCTVTGKKITTLLLEYPRAIHAQLLTHRAFSKNSSSTRAVPIESAIRQVFDHPAKFLWTGKQKGMQGTKVDEKTALLANSIFMRAKLNAVDAVRDLDQIGIHKQNAGRLLEPYQNIRVLLTSTEWDNWDWLRCDMDAQPEIDMLANLMRKAREEGFYLPLSPEEWHVPFIDRIHNKHGVLIYSHPDYPYDLSQKQAVNLSMSLSAQISFRKSDATSEKTEDIISKLFTGRKVHASPSEHQASPIPEVYPKHEISMWPTGVTHMDRQGHLWSGNFKGWIQNRQLIPNNAK